MNKKNINKNKELIKTSINKQLESVAETLQMIYYNKDCPKNISSILYNQIGIIVLCNQQINDLLENNSDSIIETSKKYS